MPRHRWVREQVVQEELAKLESLALHRSLNEPLRQIAPPQIKRWILRHRPEKGRVGFLPDAVSPQPPIFGCYVRRRAVAHSLGVQDDPDDAWRARAHGFSHRFRGS